MITLLHTASPELQETVSSPDAIEVRDVCRRWNRALASRDPDRIGGLLSDRCVLIPPNGDSVKGPGPVVEAWERIFSLPGFHLTVEPDRINLYATGETAHDIGRYHLVFHADPEGRQSHQDHGSHLLVWERTNGDWRVRSEVFFSQAVDGARLVPPDYPASADGKST